jgi:hypothetical protein
MTALEADADHRYQTADELRSALEQYLVEARMLVSQASVGQLVRRVLGTRLEAQNDAIRAALVASDGTLHAGLVPERASQSFERMSEPPSQSTAGGGPFHQTVSSWPRARRAPIGPLLFGVLGVASAVAAVIWTSQTKPIALVTTPGASEKSPSAAMAPRADSPATDEVESAPVGVTLDAIPVAATRDPRPPAPARPAAPRPPNPGSSDPEPRIAATPSDPPAPRASVELEETPLPPPEDLDVENPYKKLQEGAKPAPPPSERGAFSRGAATSALAGAARRAQACKSDEGPTGSGRATVTFSPDGPPSNVSVSAPFAGTSVGACVATAYRSARVPAFTGSAVTLPHSFHIP